MVYVVSGVEAKWSNLTALKSSLQPHAEPPYAKVKAFDCTIKGTLIQYELLECAIKGKSMQYELRV